MAKYKDFSNEDDFIESLENAYFGKEIRIKNVKILEDSTDEKLDPYANSYSSRVILIELATEDWGVVECKLITKYSCYEATNDYGDACGSDTQGQFIVECENEGFMSKMLEREEKFKHKRPSLKYDYLMGLEHAGDYEKIETEPCGCEFTTEISGEHSHTILTKCRCKRHFEEQLIAEWYDDEGYHKEIREPEEVVGLVSLEESK